MSFRSASRRRLIVEGVNINNSLVPFVVRLYNSEDDVIGFCGGFVVSPRHVATACHCVEDFVADASMLQVGVGKSLTWKKADGRLHHAVNVTMNPLYNATLGVAHGNDLCLITLREAIEEEEEEARVAVLDDGTHWTNRTDPNDNSAYVVGHGSSTVYGTQSAHLQLAHVHLHSNEACDERFGPYGPLAKSSGCASYLRYDACSGDSGSPLFLTIQGQYVVVGVVSWGIDCGGYFPGVYNRIDASFFKGNGVDARIVARPFAAVAPDCACTTDGISNNVSVGSAWRRCEDDANATFCYTRGPCHGEAAEHSVVYPGAMWRDCIRLHASPPGHPHASPPGHPHFLPPLTAPASPPPPSSSSGGGGGGGASTLTICIAAVSAGVGVLLLTVGFLVVRMRRLEKERAARRPVPHRVNHARSVHRPH